MKVNVISESQYIKEKFGGIHIAFINHVALLKKKGVDVVINSLGKADLVHIHSYGPFALFKMLTSREPKVAITHIVPESLVGSYRGGKFFFNLIKKYLIFFYNRADLIIAVNPKSKKDLEALGVKARIEVLPNQINSAVIRKDEKLRHKGRDKYGFTSRDFVIVSAGRQSPRKGVHDFVRLAKKFPQLQFVWAGGKEADVLNAQTPEEKAILENPPVNMHFLGTVSYETMGMIFNMGDILVFPSHQETQGLVIIEAAVCGLPVVVRDLPEYRQEYQEGYIACDSLEEFEQAIRKLHDNKAYYHKQVEESAKLAAKFSDAIIGDKMIELYQSLLTQ
ncbi:MAG TPA: glycosyltransferase [Patescibacteria group bacterium]|nr:glycosyltransferase [Patescibacteria group bacterium]